MSSHNIIKSVHDTFSNLSKKEVDSIYYTPNSTYMIRVDGGNVYKIGRSRDPCFRIYGFMSSNPIIDIVKVVACDVERLMHLALDDYRVTPNREFFRFTDNEVTLTGKMMYAYGGCDMTDSIREGINKKERKEEVR